MPRRSVIERLDESTRQTVDSMIRGGATIAEVHAKLRELVGSRSPGRSTVGAYMKRQRSQLQRYREAQEVARAWIAGDSEGDVARLLAEMLRTIAFQTLSDPADGATDAKDVQLLARAIRDLAAADRLHADRVLQIRREAMREATQRAADAVVSAAQAAELDEATVTTLRERVLGVSARSAAAAS